MTKNLKKVVSSIAALAISASAVSAFAVNFADITGTEDYAKAVQELSALDIISGIENEETGELNFEAEGLVTRAQMAKMIVDALGERNLAESSRGTTKFEDVSAEHWARGYINQAVQDGFIDGYDGVHFGPEDNVTYVQALRMIMSAIGYETFAQAAGGWPNGYKQYASSQGVLDGISGISDDTQLTRGQVARILDNAVDTPICVIKDWTTQWNGTRTPNLEVKDGDGKEYQTLLTKMHNAYKVYGRVTDTSKTNSSLDNDEVYFKVEKADNFDDYYITSNDNRTPDVMYFGDTDAENMLRTYAEALIQKNDDDEYTILSIVAAAANKTVDLYTDDFDRYEPNNNSLYFFPEGTTRNSQKYELDTNVTYYVNGVQVNIDTQTAVRDYIDGNTTGKVTLQKETERGTTSTSSKYNVVMITTYATAVVDQVLDKADTTTINFKSQSVSKSSMKLEKDDDTKKYTFTFEGKAIDPADLEEYDVLTIEYDIAAGFENSDFYDVQVSREIESGRYTGTSGDDGYRFDSTTTYKFAYGVSAYSFQSSTDYSLYLDVFGKIAYVDEESNSKKIGILKSVYRKNNGDYEVELIDKSASVVTYTMDEDEALRVANYFKTLDANDSNKAANPVAGALYSSGLSKYNEDMFTQVVDYKTTSAGKLTVREFYGYPSVDAIPEGVTSGYYRASTTDGSKGIYKVSSDRLGTLRLASSTVIMDLSGKDDTYGVITDEDLVNDDEYRAYGYDLNRSDSTYRYVVITEGAAKYNSKTQLAVYVERGTDVNEEDDDVTTITVMFDGQDDLQVLTLDEDYDIASNFLSPGDPIVFRTTTSGEIDDIKRVFTSAGLVDGNKSFGEFRDNVGYDIAAKIAVPETDTTFAQLLTDSDEDVDIKAGVLVKDGNGVALAVPYQKEDGHWYVNLDALGLVTSDVKVYTYDYSNGTRNNGRFVLDDAVVKTPDVNAAYVDKNNSNEYQIDHEEVKEDLVFAVVRTFSGDEAQEIYQIIAD